MNMNRASSRQGYSKGKRSKIAVVGTSKQVSKQGKQIAVQSAEEKLMEDELF